MQNEDNLNIVLVGLMGAGKSYIGQKLAKLLAHFSYIDTDAEIQNAEGLSICDIFDKYGETYFREKEAQLITEISQNKNQIISVGGGALENPESLKHLMENSLIFYLKAPAAVLLDRIKGQSNRPLLNQEFSLKTMVALLKKREKNYKKANFIIDTYKKPAYTILDDILREYESYVKK